MQAMIDRALSVLHNELLEMGSLCEQAIINAAKAITEYNLECAKTAIETEVSIRKKEREIEALCLKLLLKQQPVAKDLSKISAALKMITDMDRIGSQARNIAEIVLNSNLFEHKDNKHVHKLAQSTIKIVTDSVDAYINNDIQTCQTVIKYDKIINESFNNIKKDIVNIVFEDKKQIENAMYLLMVAKYFEKIADHASNIAGWVEFSIRGKHEGVEKS